MISEFNAQAVALILDGYDAPFIHDDCGSPADRVHEDCPCPRLHFWCAVCHTEVEA